MQQGRFFYSTNGTDVHGPVVWAELWPLLQSGALGTGSYLCEEGKEEWKQMNAGSYAPPVFAVAPWTTPPSPTKLLPRRAVNFIASPSKPVVQRIAPEPEPVVEQVAPLPEPVVEAFEPDPEPEPVVERTAPLPESVLEKIESPSKPVAKLSTPPPKQAFKPIAPPKPAFKPIEPPSEPAFEQVTPPTKPAAKLIEPPSVPVTRKVTSHQKPAFKQTEPLPEPVAKKFVASMKPTARPVEPLPEPVAKQITASPKPAEASSDFVVKKIKASPKPAAKPTAPPPSFFEDKPVELLPPGAEVEEEPGKSGSGRAIFRGLVWLAVIAGVAVGGFLAYQHWMPGNALGKVQTAQVASVETKAEPPQQPPPPIPAKASAESEVKPAEPIEPKPPEQALDASELSRLAQELLDVTHGFLEKVKISTTAENACDFKVNTITGKDDLASRRALLVKLRDTQADVKKYLDDYDAQCRDAMAKENVPPQKIDELIKGSRKGGHVDLLVELWDAKIKLTSNFISRLDFLGVTYGSWSVKDNQLLFTDEAVLADYNKLSEKLRADAQAMKDIQKQIVE